MIMYGDVNGNGDNSHLLHRSSLNLDSANPNSIELLLQQQINQQQLLSPTMHQRRDSFLQRSPTTTPMSSTSQHQAEALDHATSHVTPHTANASLHRPVNMSRSASQYSLTSTGHYRSNTHEYRTPRGSFGHASPPTEPNRSPAASQYSFTSIQQIGTQSCATELDNSNYPPTQPSNIQATTSPTESRCELSPIHVVEPMFHFDVNDIIAGTLTGDEHEIRIFSQASAASGFSQGLPFGQGTYVGHHRWIHSYSSPTGFREHLSSAMDIYEMADAKISDKPLEVHSLVHAVIPGHRFMARAVRVHPCPHH
ncbi:hypothetical protein BKA66DRAFT_43628 [Pyrenochaeta sp. MPI-SDFR-AT-0127]|nr:hypothetical protein BKA66DRAFT_43628 [Pyrenochaeta sp. MPI-SDFR-AT-0127]